MLKFGYGNTKMKVLAKTLSMPYNHIKTFDLPAGHTCPQANICKAKAHKKTGKITDSKGMIFRCYASSVEARYKNARKAHWHNFELLRGLSFDAMVTLINDSIPANSEIIRIHSSGDFFNEIYFDAWVTVAKRNPDIVMFGYTKWLDFVDVDKPDNFSLVYSFGGKMDAELSGQPTCYVVNNKADAIALNVPVICQDDASDDFEYIQKGRSFAILIHGTQPAR